MAEQKSVTISRPGEVTMQRVYLVVLGGMLCNAFISPCLTILTGMGMHTATITFWRLFIVGVTLLPFVLSKKETRQEIAHIQAQDLPMLILYCITKTCGFLLFAEAIRAGAQAFTVSILTNVAPVWMVIFLFVFFKEKTPWQSLIGIAICMFGIFIVSVENISQLNGDILSVVFGMLSAMSNSANTLTARMLRQKMSLQTLMGIGYFVSSLLSFIYAIALGAGFYVPKEALLVLAILSWGCTLCGHSASIWAVKFANPITLSLINLGSPFFTAITSFFLLGQRPAVIMFVGALVVVFGLAVNVVAGNRVRARNSTPPVEDPPADLPEDIATPAESFVAVSNPSPRFEGEKAST